MSLFKTNKIFLDSETVAEQLRSARQSKNLKLKKVAKELNINYKYLKALEKGEYEKLPEGIYGKSFFREYVLFLGLNYNELVKTYLIEKSIFEPGGQKQLFSKQIVKSKYFWAIPKIIKNIIIASIIAICFLYLGYRLNKVITPPTLFIDNPPEFLITKEYSVQISGKTESEAKVVINNEPILSDANGNFAKVVNLKNGINTINITAYKKYSKSNTVIRQILVKPR